MTQATPAVEAEARRPLRARDRHVVGPTPVAGAAGPIWKRDDDGSRPEEVAVAGAAPDDENADASDENTTSTPAATTGIVERSAAVRPPDDSGSARATRSGDSPRRARRKRKVRRVHRVIRHVEIWSVAKVAAVFAVCGYVVVLVSGYLLWRAADRVGTIEGIEGFFEDAGGYDHFQILGDVVFRAVALGGAVLALFGVAAAVLGAVLFNLISDLTGGIRMTVIDEDLVVTPVRPRRAPSSGEDSSQNPGPNDDTGR